MNSTIILTLDAGGTNFNFSAIQNGSRVGDILSLPAHADNLDKCLDTLKKGFRHLMDESVAVFRLDLFWKKSFRFRCLFIMMETFLPAEKVKPDFCHGLTTNWKNKEIPNAIII